MSITGNYKYSDATRAYYDSIVNTEKYIGIAHLLNLEVTTAFTKQISFCVGVDYRHDEFKYYSLNFSNVTVPTKYPTLYQLGGYSTLKYTSLNNKYQASLGYRINQNNIANIDNSYFITNAYQFNKKVGIISNISSGFTTPSIYAAKDSFVGNEKLLSEHSISFQIGVEYKTKSWQQRLMMFHNNINNGIDFNSNIGTFSNCNGFNIRGIEYETKLKLTNHFSFYGNYTFLAGKETTISRQDYTDTITYPYLVRIPKHIVNAGLSYHDKRFTTSITGRWVSNYYDVGWITNDYPMKSYIVLGSSFSYSPTNHLKCIVDIQNLANNKFIDTRGFNSTPFVVQVGVRLLL